MDTPKRRSGPKTVTCSGLTMYCASRVRLGAQHNATLTTQQSLTQHTTQRYTHDTAEPSSAHAAAPHSRHSRARLRTRRSATLTTQQRPAPHTPQRHTHNSRARLGTRCSATLTTQQSLTRHTTQRHTHDTAEASVLRPYLIRGAGPYPGCSVYLVLMAVIWCGILSGQNRVPRISRGRTGPAYHHPGYLLGEFLFLSFNV